MERKSHVTRGKCGRFVLQFLILSATCSISLSSSVPDNDNTLFDKGYRGIYRVYEECQQRNIGLATCLKKKAITFCERLGKIDTLPISDTLELVKVPGSDAILPKDTDLESRAGGNKDETLNEILLERIASLMNSFNVQIRLPKTSSGELKRGFEEGRGKMKKMMGMMMMGMAMKMAALVPIAMGVLFLLAGKALIISKIALVLSLIIGLKKLLSQKQGHETHHASWQQGGGGGWDRSLKGVLGALDSSDQEYAHTLAYKTGASQ